MGGGTDGPVRGARHARHTGDLPLLLPHLSCRSRRRTRRLRGDSGPQSRLLQRRYSESYFFKWLNKTILLIIDTKVALFIQIQESKNYSQTNKK